MDNINREVNRSREEHVSNPIMTILGVILCVIFGFMLICNMTIIVKGTLAPERPPAVFGVTPMVVLSGSMSGDAEDHIEAGDLIFVTETEASELEVGDVIAFMEGKVVVTHRIIEIQTDDDNKLQFITKGDANNATDQRPVSEDNLVGIYMSRIPKLGDFALFLQTPLGMVIFIGIPVFAFIIYDIIRRQQYMNRENKKTAEMEAELERLRKLAGESGSSAEKK